MSNLVPIMITIPLMFQGTMLEPGENKVPEEWYDDIKARHDSHLTERTNLLVPPAPEGAAPDADKLLVQTILAGSLTLRQLSFLMKAGVQDGRWTEDEIGQQLQIDFEPNFEPEPEDENQKASSGNDEVTTLENRVKELETQVGDANKPSTPAPTSTPAPETPPPAAGSAPATTHVKLPPSALKALREAGLDLANPEAIRAKSDDELLALDGIGDDSLAKIRQITAA